MYALQETLTHEFDWVDMVLVSTRTTSQKTLTPIRYTITTVEGGVQLSIWEIASPTTSRPASYLYKLNYRLNSEEEVQDILNWYLQGVSEFSPVAIAPDHSSTP
jgi:hypothetical protein